RPDAPSAWPDGCARRSIIRRSTRLWRTTFITTSKTSSASARRYISWFISNTSLIRSRRRWPIKVMFYSIRHTTRFVYTPPVSESMTEVRMQPRAEGGQRCLKFELHTQPRARILGYRDHMGNIVHHFDIPGKHSQLKITAESTVEIASSPYLPESLNAGAWEPLDAINQTGAYWDYLAPSQYAFKT